MEQVYIMPRFAPVGLGGCCGCVWMPLRFAGFACRCASLRLGVPLRFAAFGVPLRFGAFGGAAEIRRVWGAAAVRCVWMPLRSRRLEMRSGTKCGTGFALF